MRNLTGYGIPHTNFSTERELNCRLGKFRSSYCLPPSYTIVCLCRFWNYENRKLPNCVRIGHTCQMFRRECRNRGIHQSMWIFRRINTLWQDVLNICHYDTWASESRPERVQLCVHTPGPTGPVREPFHCDHIARWSARSGTPGRSGTGVNTGARLRSGTVPVPKLWCEHGLILLKYVCLSVFANGRSQFFLDRLGRCL